MKKLVVVVLLLLCACVPEPEQFLRKYVIQNDSGVEVQVSFFREGIPIFEEVSNNDILNNLDRLGGSNVRGSVDPSSLPQSEIEGLAVSSFYSADSVLLIFNGTKRLSYTNLGASEFSESLNRNLFRDSNYQDIGNDEFLYRITEADFERAEDCQGDCN